MEPSASIATVLPEMSSLFLQTFAESDVRHHELGALVVALLDIRIKSDRVWVKASAMSAACGPYCMSRSP
jgi:hypothetical protein